jgi:hypothetical protein
MSTRTRIINCFGPAGHDLHQSPLLLLDLTLWHKWHQARGTLPAGWTSVVEAAKALGTGAWAPFKAWRVEHDGVEVTTDETSTQRDIIYRAGGRSLLARWTIGPDGDWWQAEYPVKTPEDLQAAVEIAAARRYVLDAAGLGEWRAAVGEEGVVPLELPMRPYSDILHTMVGWGDGLALMLGDGKPLVGEIVASLEGALARLLGDLAGLEGDLLLAPDNLDGQYISPRVFKEFLAPSYAATAEIARQCRKRLVVHLGGPGRKLVPLLAQAGVDGIEGIAGAPQGDANLAEARLAAGSDVTLWGGIPQDMLLAEHDDETFASAVREAVEQARADANGRTVIGVADKVPVDAEIDRLRQLVEMVG